MLDNFHLLMEKCGGEIGGPGVEAPMGRTVISRTGAGLFQIIMMDGCKAGITAAHTGDWQGYTGQQCCHMYIYIYIYKKILW